MIRETALGEGFFDEDLPEARREGGIFEGVWETGFERRWLAEGRRAGRPGTCGLAPARRVTGFNDCGVFAEGRVAGLDEG